MTSRQTEISDEEILTQCGPLLWDALKSFGEDPAYFAQMSESANLIQHKRALWEARALAVAQAEMPDEVPLLEKILLEKRAS